jgi:hypothetical protein
MVPPPKKRPRASPELLAVLRAGKVALHRQRENLALREKVRMVLDLQRLCLPLIERRRRLAEWERPWAITP